MSRLIDLSGRKLGRLTVVSRAGKPYGRHIYWNCICECGNKSRVGGFNLRDGHTTSCGCANRDSKNLKHGHARSPFLITNEYSMHASAKLRAKRNGIEFNIAIDDVVIPEFCPLLNIRLKRGVKKLTDTSPTLDRIDQKLGYIRGNVWVISYKANRCKSNLDIDELRLLVAGLEKRMAT